MAQIPRFFVEHPLPTEVGATLFLGVDRARQARSVLRLRPGSTIVAFDGSGVEAVATIDGLSARECSASITSLERPDREPRRRVHVGLAMLRGDQTPLAVQKLTELGVDRITLLAADHCVIALRTAQERDQRVERLQRIAIEAAEQAERVTIPRLDGPVDATAFFADARPVVLLERSESRHLTAYARTGNGSAVTLAIGPEGGWSAAEREQIAALGLDTAHLGRLILRAETCAIAALTTVLHVGCGDDSDETESMATPPAGA